MKSRSQQVAAFRLRRHHFVDRVGSDVAAVSRDVCGIQCQLMSAAELALWARIPGLKRTDIQTALWEGRSLIKTSCMRGTLHLLTVEDFPIYISALRPSRTRQTMRILARFGVSAKEAARVKEVVLERLAQGSATRGELTELVLSMNIVGEEARAWFEQGWWGVVRHPIVEGTLCYGPDQGQQTTLVRVDRWLLPLKEVSPEEALRIILRRFLAAYGPATPRDFSKWSSCSMEEIKVAWASIASELTPVRVGEAKAWLLESDLDVLASSRVRSVVRLLPVFDPYMLAHADKGHLVAPEFYKRVYRKAGWLSPVVLLNGTVIGVWGYKRRGKRLSVVVTPFESFSKRTRTGIEREVARLADFFDTPCDLEFEHH